MGDRQTRVCTTHGVVLWTGDPCPYCIGQELEEAPEPPEPGPAATAEMPATGRHRDDAGPSTGPLHRIGRSPSGRHQEHDLEPKRWPWALLVGASATAALVLGYTWGYGQGQTTVAAQRVHVPADVVTVTSASTRKPGPTKTKTVAKKVPGPTKTVVREVPGPTIWSNPTPAPPKTVTKTRTVTVREPAEEAAVVKICLDISLEEIECPNE